MRSYPRVSWRLVAVALFVAYAVPSLALSVIAVQWNVAFGGPVDWLTWRPLVEGLPDVTFGSTAAYAYIYSPAFAFVLAAIVPAGFWFLTALRFASLLLLRDWRLAALVLVSWGFWFDTAFGNFFTFSFVAAALALRGSKSAGLAYLVLFLLMPRPVELPLALWLLWKLPGLRIPFGWLFVAHAAFVIAGGWVLPWFGAMTDLGAGDGQWFWNVGPTRIMGNLWLAFGVPIAVYLTVKGRPGLAGLALSPYIVPQYLLFAFLGRDQAVGDDRVQIQRPWRERLRGAQADA